MTTETQIDKMVELRLEGKTLQEIGDLYGLTRERIRQLLAGRGMTGTPWTGYKPYHYQRLAVGISKLARRIDQTCPPESEHYPHGSLRGYRRGCKCAPCRRANADYYRRPDGMNLERISNV